MHEDWSKPYLLNSLNVLQGTEVSCALWTTELLPEPPVTLSWAQATAEAQSKQEGEQCSILA